MLYWLKSQYQIFDVDNFCSCSFPVIDSLKFWLQEAFGRYLDMHELYHQYVNSKFGEPIEYSSYLDVFSETDKIPCKMKMTR